MELLEYLALFSNNGPVKVRVKFKDFDGTVAEQRMLADEIGQLVSPETGEFQSNMTFDDWPFEVYKYEIDPIKRVLTIRARKISNQ
jgi:hypothetical protein